MFIKIRKIMILVHKYLEVPWIFVFVLGWHEICSRHFSLFWFIFGLFKNCTKFIFSFWEMRNGLLNVFEVAGVQWHNLMWKFFNQHNLSWKTPRKLFFVFKRSFHKIARWENSRKSVLNEKPFKKKRKKN